MAKRIPRLALAAAFVAGLVVAGFVWRRQVAALIARSQRYVRRTSRVQSPALIINRWSGDGKAEKYGLVEAAQEAGVRTIMLERGDDLTQLARQDEPILAFHHGDHGIGCSQVDADDVPRLSHGEIIPAPDPRIKDSVKSSSLIPSCSIRT